MTRAPVQRWRAWSQVGFFCLFLLAPPLDILRIDLTQGHAILLGQAWTLGIDEFLAGRTGPGDAALNLLLRGFLPIFGGAALFIWSAWRYGRLYCGWLCPHFSVVELINGLMRRASGKPSLWERRRAGDCSCVPSMSPVPGGPRRDSADVGGIGAGGNNPCGNGASASKGPQWKTLRRAGGGAPTGRAVRPNPWYWVPTLLAVAGFAFLWAVAFLTYLLPPFEVYHNLLHGTLTRNQAIFLTAATLALSVEFLLARHFFCRYACAVGLFQSLAWMANDRAMVVGFDTRRAAACAGCDNVCDHACPMRLKPRTIKRKMFTCTECGECIAACTQVQGGDPRQSLLRWVEGDAALPVVTGRPVPNSAPCPAPVPSPDPAEPSRQMGV
jgi:ferredoxin-type protein NapH